MDILLSGTKLQFEIYYDMAINSSISLLLFAQPA